MNRGKTIMRTLKETLSPEALGFDPEALTERYRRERDKRIRDDAEAQFIAVS